MHTFSRFTVIALSLLVSLSWSCNRSSESPRRYARHSTSKATYPVANAFDFPVGKPDAKGYYNAQPFGENLHLGDDWNAVTGGNTDLGDPIYAIANGLVKMAENIYGGWGNVIIIEHRLPGGKRVESLYAHCDEILVSEGDVVRLGDKIATIGNAGGIYLAHLHFEIRDEIDMGVGGGYSSDTEGYVDPTAFIKQHRRTR